MKSINHIRKELEDISGAIIDIDIPPNEVPTGAEDEVVSLWNKEMLGENTNDLSQVTEKEQSPPDRILDPIFEYGAENNPDQLVKNLGKDETEKIRKSIEVKGIDALAWYVSYHYRGLQWGIYIPISSLVFLAYNVFGSLPCNGLTKIKLAFRALHQHELFHFSTDYMTSQIELITRKPCHVISRPKLKNNGGYIAWEEQLANAAMLQSILYAPGTLKVPNAYKQLLVAIVKQQPAGYRDGPKVVKTKPFIKLAEKLAQDFIAYIPDYELIHADNWELWPLYGRYERLHWENCPVHIIHDEKRFGIAPWFVDYFGSVAINQETDEFKKRLLELGKHVPKLWKKACRFLASVGPSYPGLGFEKWRSRPDGTVYSVRLNDDIRVHVLYDKSSMWTALKVGHHKEMGHG
ncbi:MAG: hypothetical protein Q7T03_02170 [Deltaproteobacteria bacterium]|nr:hypothetical protein [Deltaproteobacteria bacterium]